MRFGAQKALILERLFIVTIVLTFTALIGYQR